MSGALRSLDPNAPAQHRPTSAHSRPSTSHSTNPLKRPNPTSDADTSPQKRPHPTLEPENVQPAQGPPSYANTDLDTASLGAYAAQPDATRAVVLDNLICRYINDDAFLQLCQDVEGAWRRVGLEPPRR